MTSAIQAVADYDQRQRKLAVSVVALVLALDILDGTIVNVAVPSIQHSLHATSGQVQWMISGYALCFALLLVTAGRLGDLLGYRQMFILGVAGFTAASILCGLAWSADSLIAARALQGIMAAMMAPQGMALVQILYRPHERAAVMGIFGAVGGASAVLGPVVGGLLLQADLFGLDWRPIFLVNAPIGLGAVLCGVFILPRGRSPQPLRPDFTGIVLLSVALLLLVGPLVEGRALGWPVWLSAMPAAAVPAFFVVWKHMLRRDAQDGAALVPPALVREPVFAIGSVLNLLFQLAVGGYMLAFTLLLQQGLGYSPLRTALTTVPFAASVGFGISVISRRLAGRLGRNLLTLGLLTMAAGFAAMIAALALVVPPTGETALLPWLLLPALVVAGLGMGMVIGPMGSIVLSRVDVTHAGSASGVLSSVQQVGLASGVAGLGTVFYAVLTRQGHAAAAVAHAHAFEIAVGGSVTLLLCAALVSRSLPERAYFKGQDTSGSD